MEEEGSIQSGMAMRSEVDDTINETWYWMTRRT